MIDFQVAFDKLAQFQTADEIAKFFQQERIKGTPKTAGHCPVAHWMSKQTQKETFVSKHLTHGSNFDTENAINSEAMFVFIHRFDSYEYPSLINRSNRHCGCHDDSY